MIYFTEKYEILQNGERERKRILDGLPFGKRVALKMLLPLAHSCVANREKTKSFVIRFGYFTIYFCQTPGIFLKVTKHSTREWFKQVNF